MGIVSTSLPIFEGDKLLSARNYFELPVTHDFVITKVIRTNALKADVCFMLSSTKGDH